MASADDCGSFFIVVPDTYSTLKERLAQVPFRLQDAAGSEAAKKSLAALGRKIAGNEFSLVVAGQFKRGKSTFINSVLGENLLPTAIIPLTSIITIIKFGEALQTQVFFSDGSRREIGAADLPLYITEKHNPKNEKNVGRVEILYPSPYLKNGVQIIDTPGVASVYGHNTGTTYRYLPHADAAVFMISVDPPITAAELKFLGDLKGYATRIFFVLNKVDMVSAADRQESLEFTRQIIEEQAGLKNVEIFPLSARQALEGKTAPNPAMLEESGLPAFENMLDGFLLGEKGRVFLISATGKIRNLISQEAFSAQLMQKSLSEPLQDLEGKMRMFESAQAEINQERQDSNRLLKAETAELIATVLEEDLKGLKAGQTGAAAASVNTYYQKIKKESNRALARLFDRYVHDRIRDIFTDFQEQEEKKLEEMLAQIINRLVARTNSIIARLVDISARIFDVSIEPFAIDEALAAESRFQFKLDEDVKVSLEAMTESATLLMPRRLGHRLILKEARERMEKQIDRHCGRLRHDFSERIQATLQQFRTGLDETVNGTEESIRRALLAGSEAKQKSEAELRRFEGELRLRLLGFEQARQELAGIEEAAAAEPAKHKTINNKVR